MLLRRFHEIKAWYVSNIVTERYVTRMKKRKENFERNFQYYDEKKKCFLDSVWRDASWFVWFASVLDNFLCRYFGKFSDCN